jgi:sugar phosphate permease
MIYTTRSLIKKDFRWVYIIEGVFSTVIAVAVWFGLPTNPAETWFLTAEQKAIMVIRQKQTAEYLGGDESKRYEFWVALKDPKLYLSAAIQLCQDILLYGFSTFLPAILKAAGHNSLQSNYLTVPVYIFGAIAFIIAAVFSDRLRLRSPVSISAAQVHQQGS